jgi:hypothetical protein
MALLDQKWGRIEGAKPRLAIVKKEEPPPARTPLWAETRPEPGARMPVRKAIEPKAIGEN